MDNKEVPVKVAPLMIIKQAAMPILFKVDSILRDLYHSKYVMSDEDYLDLLELRSATQIVRVKTTDLIEQAKEAGVDTVHLPFEEFKMLLASSRVIEAIPKTKNFRNIVFWSH